MHLAFDSPRELLVGARDHISDLEVHINAFFDRKPYTRIVEIDRETGQHVHKIRLTAKISGRAARIAKDAFSNLRDALDHAVYASTVALRPGRVYERTAFPFAETAALVHDKLNTKLLDVPPEIRTLLEALCPHKTGNQLLWGLNRTRNVKTHRVLVPLLAASAHTGVGIRGGYSDRTSFGNRWVPEKNEVEYMRTGPNSNFQYDVDVSFEVLFGDVEVFGAEPAIATLNAVFSEVERIVAAIEAETERLLRSSP